MQVLSDYSIITHTCLHDNKLHKAGEDAMEMNTHI